MFCNEVIERALRRREFLRTTAGAAGILGAWLLGPGRARAEQDDNAPDGELPISTTNPVVDFNDHSIIHGYATLTRRDDRIDIRLTAASLEPGIYTFWWGVTNPGEDLTAGWSSSREVAQGGMVNFSADLSVNEILMLHPLSGGALEDPRNADIIMVIRYHGPVDPDNVTDQRHTFQPEGAANAFITIHNAP